MGVTLSKSQVGHLRQLLGWVAGEIGQSPEEMAETLKTIASSLSLDKIDDEGKERIVAAYTKAQNVPSYVRSAVKQLRIAIKDQPGEVVDAYVIEQRQLPRA